MIIIIINFTAEPLKRGHIGTVLPVAFVHSRSSEVNCPIILHGGCLILNLPCIPPICMRNVLIRVALGFGKYGGVATVSLA